MTRTFALPYGQSILEIVISEELTIDLYLPADMNKNTDYSLDINSAIRNSIIKFEFPSFIDRNT
ncbi:MAG: hypothetical protein Q8T08_08210, partial [Ignavibacteria bacterium]|nr:hypothetical protein [Ignavibacteria bacterium]